ncbi:HAD-IA family hydrolase [Terriglobus saanensis]|uniref:HAD-superfamily hydrolase, subfamily IA, variant 3 n=1 Tax=Terriglobus saanensis (strain ATCC BAA-1853 / DSM 23119 / SP1PR4) TaxID=401053 RepID=E8V5K1_TERSS|nr:HAD-IA family hydrolase [Terriglobus saanensis]ADV81535.1 HAD-superfamily hydrolase, subfamily IA, variant 3 [Terriglobus saanensis SP1PR4]
MIEVEVGAFLFDMDGVLVSSIGSVRRSWRKWAKMYGLPDSETFEIPHGQRAREIIQGLIPEKDVDEGLRVIEEIEMADTDDLIILPGVRALLESLPKERWAIVTSATNRLVIARLEVAGLPIPTRLVSADSVERGKPAPDPYLAGAKLLGISPGDCLVVEDAPSGLQSGKAAGAKLLGVLGTHALEDLGDAMWVVESMESVRVEVGERLRVSLDVVR